jgi:nitrogen fixation NifU-like protein
MTDLHDLYQELILDHNARPRNFGRIEECSHHAEGVNPLCGDHITLYVQVENDTIKDIRFEGSGCAISKSSASLLTEAIKGKSLEKARALFHTFHLLLTDKNTHSTENLGKLAAFSGVKEFPMRVKCATLAWHTFMAALEKNTQPVSTEASSHEH